MFWHRWEIHLWFLHSALLTFFKFHGSCFRFIQVYTLIVTLLCILFFFCCRACRVLVPSPGTESTFLTLERQSLNHWTTRKTLSSALEMPHFHTVTQLSCIRQNQSYFFQFYKAAPEICIK